MGSTPLVCLGVHLLYVRTYNGSRCKYVLTDKDPSTIIEVTRLGRSDHMEARVNLRLPSEDVKRWKHAAINLDITLSELVRVAVNKYLDEIEKSERTKEE